MKASDKSTSIYGLIDPKTQELRYIGKTVKPVAERFRAHINLAKSGNKTHRCNWIRVLLVDGLKPITVIIETIPPGGDWAEAESFWIEYYRAIGCDLTNLTLGGEGREGYTLSDESRKKLSGSQKKRFEDPAARAKISAARKGKPLTDEHRAALVGRVVSDETRARIGAAHILRFQDPNERAKVGAFSRGRKHSPETRVKISAANLGRKHSAESRAKMSMAQTGRKLNPEHIEKTASANRGKKLSPEHRAAISAAQTGRITSEQHRYRISEALKGRPLSLEHRAKVSAGHVGKILTEEHRKNISAALCGRKMTAESVEKVTAAKRKNGPRSGGFKGVYRNKDRWTAQISIDGKLRYLGIFDLAEDAARAYDTAAYAAYGPGCYLNFGSSYQSTSAAKDNNPAPRVASAA